MTTELLKQSSLFKDFTPVGLQIFSKVAQPKIVLAGSKLFAEGAPAEALYLLVEGRIQVLVKNAEGKEVPVASLGPGDNLSEMALLSPDKPVAHIASAVAETDAKLLEISKADFVKLSGEKPQACLKLSMAMSQDFGAKALDARDALRLAVARAVAR